MHLDTAGRRIEVGRTGRLLHLLGFLLALVGILFAYALLTGGHGIMAGERPAGPADLWLPVLLVLVGLALSGYSAHTEIDIGSRTRTHHRRFWWNVRSEREALGEPLHVTFSAEQRGSGQESHVAYPVRLVTSTDSVELAAPGNERRGRRHAEAAARLCGLPLHDLRGGTPLVRDPADLDRPVLDLYSGDPPPAPPSGCRVRVERDGDTTVVRVPSPAAWFLPLLIVPALVPLVFLRFLGWPRGGGPPGLHGSILLMILIVVFAIPAVVVLVAARRGGLLPARIVVRRGRLEVGSRIFPAAELEELHVAGGPRFLGSHLRAESDHESARMGRGLSPDELAYARGLILGALRESR